MRKRRSFHLQSQKARLLFHSTQANAKIPAVAIMRNNILVYLLLCMATLVFSLLHGYANLRGSFSDTREARSFSPTRDFRSVASASKASPQAGRPTFLWGIPTIAQEKEQRQLIRDTYLRYYRYFDSDSSHNRICSLADIQKKRVELGDCQVAYAFFMGANPDGPTELVAPNSSFPMEIDPSTIQNPEEDVIYLNIKENMEDGKSQTWFKYGSMIAEQYGFDYIAKVDSDALFFIPKFLDHVDKTLKPSPYNERVYGGLPFYSNSCDMNETNQPHACPLPLVGPYYFSGEFYFMSPDLAAFIASDQVDRKKLAIYHEDVDIGNFVYSHPKKISSFIIEHRQVLRYPDMDANYTIREFPFNDTFWAHTPSWGGGWYKKRVNFLTTWKEFLNNHYLFNTRRENIYKVFDYPKKDPSMGLIQPDDLIYAWEDPYVTPVVIESHKLVFFLVGEVGDVLWIKLFRRMMKLKKWRKMAKNPNAKNQLRYLHEYNMTEANRIMTSPEYTRAIFVRDPKDRLLSLFKEYSNSEGRRSLVSSCCEGHLPCIKKGQKLDGFVKLVLHCNQAVWRPQGERMEPKYFKTLNFIGRYENIKKDAPRLLEQIGAWEEYGKSGWGLDGDEAIFNANGPTRNLTGKLMTSYSRKSERLVEQIYNMDYSNALFNFSEMTLFPKKGTNKRAIK